MNSGRTIQTSYCTNCGHPIEEGAAYCTNCGARSESLNAQKPRNIPQQYSQSNAPYSKRSNYPGLNTGKGKGVSAKLLSSILVMVIALAFIITFTTNLLGRDNDPIPSSDSKVVDPTNSISFETAHPQNEDSKIIWHYLFNPINISNDFNYDIHRFFSHNNAFYITQPGNYYYFPTGYAIDMNSAYFPSELTQIVSVDLQSGNMNWRSELSGFVLGIGDNTVFVLTSDDRIYGLDKKTGSEKWKIYLKLLVEENDYYSLYPQIIQLSESYYLPVVTDCPHGLSLRFLKIDENSGESGYTRCNAEVDESLVPLLVLGDQLFAANESFYNLNIEDGTVNWIIKSPRDISSSLDKLNVLDLDIDKGTFYYYTGMGSLEDIYAIDIYTGNPIWPEGLIKRNGIKTDYLAGEIYSVERFIILDSNLGIIYIFDKDDGLLINQIEAERKHEIYTAENGLIINYYDIGMKFGVDYASGVELWKDDETVPYQSSKVGGRFLHFQDVLLIPDEHKDQVAIDQKTGAKLWTKDINHNEEFGFHNGYLVYFNGEALERINIQNGTTTSINLNELGSANYDQGHIRIINDALWMICGRNMIMLNMQ